MGSLIKVLLIGILVCFIVDRTLKALKYLWIEKKFQQKTLNLLLYLCVGSIIAFLLFIF